MKNRLIPLALMFGLVVPATVLGQTDDYERGQLYQVSTREVLPAHAEAYESIIEKVVEAAKKGNIGVGYRWAFWSKGSTYTLVYPVANYAYFDTPDQFMRAFEGTEGEALMQEAFAEFENIARTVLMDEISELKAEWSYEPESGGVTTENLKFGHIDEIWLKSGTDEEFAELNKEWLSLFKDINYPYAYDGHEVHFGDSGRVVYVTFIDDLAEYYGVNDMMALVEAAGATERMEALDARFNAIAERWDHYNMSFMPNMTYWPTEEMASN